jgi:hypothetical protein
MGNYIAHHITWRGMAITIRHATDWPIPEYDHIEVISENDQPLPITETGYRSHFIPSSLVAEHDNAIAFVTAWLDHEAKSKAWQEQTEAGRQMSLFSNQHRSRSA